MESMIKKSSDFCSDFKVQHEYITFILILKYFFLYIMINLTSDIKFEIWMKKKISINSPNPFPFCNLWEH